MAAVTLVYCVAPLMKTRPQTAYQSAGYHLGDMLLPGTAFLVNRVAGGTRIPSQKIKIKANTNLKASKIKVWLVQILSRKPAPLATLLVNDDSAGRSMKLLKSHLGQSHPLGVSFFIRSGNSMVRLISAPQYHGPWHLLATHLSQFISDFPPASMIWTWWQRSKVQAVGVRDSNAKIWCSKILAARKGKWFRRWWDPSRHRS
jgi:hypothetical protein